MFLLFFLFTSLLAQGQEWKHVLKIGGIHCDAATGLALLPNEDLILTGIYEDKGGTTLQSSNGNHHTFDAGQDTFPKSHSTLFLARYTPAGELVWATNALAEQGITPWGITSDKLGNSIVCGNFRGQAIFISTDGSRKKLQGAPPKRPGEQPPLNHYVAKYSPSGKLMWVKTGTSTENAVSFQAVTDNQDNIYVRAYCSYGMMSFDSHVFFPKNETGYTFGNFGLIVIKYRPDGIEEWVTRGGNFTITDLHADGSGNTTLRGSYTHRAAIFTTSGKTYTFDLPAGAPAQRATIHLNNKGELVKIAPEFPELTEGGIRKYVRDDAQNYYALLTPQPTARRNQYALRIGNRAFATTMYDTFVAKFDKNQQLIWISQLTGPNNVQPLDIVLDKQGNIVFSGHYRGEMRVQDITGAFIELKSGYYQSLFLASFTTDGLLKWASNSGNMYKGFSEHLHLVVNSENQLFAAGQLNAPSELGKHKVNASGEKGWTSPGAQVDYSKCSDGFLALIDLNETVHYDVVLNLSLNYKEAARIISKSVALIKTGIAAVVPPPAVNQSIAFTPVVLDPETNSGSTSLDALLYPNPAGPGQPEVTAQIVLPAAAQVKWQLLTQNGAVLWQESRQYTSGIASYQFSVQGLPAGMYLLVISTGNQRHVKKLVVG